MQLIKFNDNNVIPSKVVCIGRNYVDHIAELGNEIPTNMVIFSKPNSAISRELKFLSDDVRYEGELCFLIKDKKIAGIGFGLDLTYATLQNELKKKRLPWERAKSFNGSAVLSEFVVFDGDLSMIRFELFINGALRQAAGYEQMMYKPIEMIQEIENFMNLEDGDIIMSGTPKGIGNYQPSDEFVARVYEGEKLLLETVWQVKP